MKKLFGCLLMMSIGTSSFAYNSVWKVFSGDRVPSRGTNYLKPSRYKIYTPDITALQSVLTSASSNPASGILVELPAPDGSFKTYKVWKQSNMHPDLEAKYPEIISVTGYDIDNKSATVVMDIAPRGFHAMVLNGDNTYFIDPYSDVNDGYYLCYYKRDYTRTGGMMPSCAVAEAVNDIEEGRMEINTGNGLPDIQFVTNGADKRTYRLALACSGEYAKAVDPSGPTKSNVIAAMNTTMNRVNGVYRSELGVEMILIADNDELVFLDGTTDTFTSKNAPKMQQENQGYLNDHIGTGNYDIGHVFDAGSASGIAELESVCNGIIKAKGVTGQVNPVGDAFDIDFVAHEMGHQFGARHTFNAKTGACGGSNAAMNSAYEPGSGSTIMAYAGLCTANDLQQHSDDYFHSISLEQIADFVVVGNGASCASTSSSGNTPASVPSVSADYFIPYLTPFELTAPTATDNDHDALTYCWEQRDLGDFGISFESVELGPLFRSYSPMAADTRVFPRLDYIRANVSKYMGEKLPEIDRILTFKLVVRDILNGWGIFNSSDDEVIVKVLNTGTPFAVTVPNESTAYWQVGSTQTVNWEVAGTATAPISTSGVDIYLSLDDGQTYPYLLAQNVPNSGSAQVTVPADAHTLSARVKVKGAGNIFFDISNQSFIINSWPASVAGISWANDVKLYPIPAKDMLHVDLVTGKNFNLTALNALGQVLWTGNAIDKAQINTSGWAAGVYILQLTDKQTGEKSVKQFVVE